MYKSLCIAIAVMAVTLAGARNHAEALLFAATPAAAAGEAWPTLAQGPVNENNQGGARFRLPSSRYRVTGVAANDVLNIRSGADAGTGIVGTIPPNGTGIRIIDRCAGAWCPIEYRGVRGWVNQRYLTSE